MKYNLIFLFVFVSSVLVAQENQPFPKQEEMCNRKWQFLAQKAQLSAKETEAVRPVFMEYEKSLWSFHDKNGTFFKSIKNSPSDAAINYSEINDRYAEMGEVRAQMFKSYHLKLRKLLAPETLFKYYMAEREFKRELLQTLEKHPRGRKQFKNRTID